MKYHVVIGHHLGQRPSMHWQVLNVRGVLLLTRAFHGNYFYFGVHSGIVYDSGDDLQLDRIVLIFVFLSQVDQDAILGF